MVCIIKGKKDACYLLFSLFNNNNNLNIEKKFRHLKAQAYLVILLAQC